jgi:hypothetical protein
MTDKTKFIVEAVCSETDCIAIDSILEVENLSTLLEIIMPPNGKFHPAAKYELETSQVTELESAFGITLPRGEFYYRLRCWHRLDNLPYKVHTNRELKMMLDGIKPLASFTEPHPSEFDFELIPESLFSQYVERGLMIKREFVCNLSRLSGTRYVLYARRQEEWRIDAYILLKLTAEVSGWNQALERMEGTLLGYEEWQNSAYIKMTYG